MKPSQLPAARTTCPACGGEKKICEEAMREKWAAEKLPMAHFGLITGQTAPNGMTVVMPLGFDVGSELMKRVAQPRFEICGDCGCVYVKYWEVAEARPQMNPQGNGNSSEAIRKKLLG